MKEQLSEGVDARLNEAVEEARAILAAAETAPGGGGWANTAPEAAAAAAGGRREGGARGGPALIRVSKQTDAGPLAFLAVVAQVQVTAGSAPGCLQLLLASLGAAPSRVLLNLTPHALRFRESTRTAWAALWCPLQPYSSAPLARQALEGGAGPAEVEISEPRRGAVSELLRFNGDDGAQPGAASHLQPHSAAEPSSRSPSAVVIKVSAAMTLGPLSAASSASGSLRPYECLAHLADAPEPLMLPSGLAHVEGVEDASSSVDGASEEGRAKGGGSVGLSRTERLIKIVPRPLAIPSGPQVGFGRVASHSLRIEGPFSIGGGD